VGEGGCLLVFVECLHAWMSEGLGRSPIVDGLEPLLEDRRAWLPGAIFAAPGRSLNAEPPAQIPPFPLGGAHGGVY